MSAPAATVESLSPWTQGDRALTMRRAYLAYIGRPAIKPLRPRSGEPDDNVIIPLPRVIVDKGVSFLFGQDVKSLVGEQGKATPQQDWLDECWRRNKRMLCLQKLATNGGICGHSFARLLDVRPFPRVIVLDPRVVEVETAPDDCETITRYTIGLAPDADGNQRRQVIAQDPRALRWTIADQQMTGGAWVTTATSDWRYDFGPVVDCQNLPRPNDTWGETDLPEDVQVLLTAINRVASHINKIVRIHAHPKLWARGMGSRTIDVSIDSVLVMPSETAELRALEMQSDLSAALAHLDNLLETLSHAVRIPRVALGKPDNAGSLSGVALHIRYQPLIEKTETKRRTYGDLVSELDRRLLAMGGFGEGTITTLQWPELLPTDPLMERQVFVLDESLGLVSKQTLSEKLGYDYESELKKRAKDVQTAVPQPGANPVPGAAQPGGEVPPPAALQAPAPDIARTSKSS